MLSYGFVPYENRLQTFSQERLNGSAKRVQTAGKKHDTLWWSSAPQYLIKNEIFLFWMFYSHFDKLKMKTIVGQKTKQPFESFRHICPAPKIVILDSNHHIEFTPP